MSKIFRIAEGGIALAFHEKPALFLKNVNPRNLSPMLEGSKKLYQTEGFMGEKRG